MHMERLCLLSLLIVCSEAGKWHGMSGVMNEMLQQTPEIVLFVLAKMKRFDLISNFSFI